MEGLYDSTGTPGHWRGTPDQFDLYVREYCRLPEKLSKPMTREISRLVHPRSDRWRKHFVFNGAKIVGLARVGRATVAVLALNDPIQSAIRQSLLNEGLLV
jgi:hypothetical protein